MIAHIKGTVTALAPDSVVLDVAGVGLLVHCGPSTLAKLRVGEPAHIYTSLVVREDSLTVYGFESDDERNLFELLQTASGVGPRLAQAVLAVHAPDEVRRTIIESDIAALTQVSGIGKKGAERLILELKDRIGPVSTGHASERTGRSAGGAGDNRAHVVAGLVALGWSTALAESAADQAMATVLAQRSDDSEAPNVSAVLKHAIGLLGRA